MTGSKRCQPCIMRHTKCNGRRPMCEQCEQIGQECTWPRGVFNGSVFRCEIKFASGSVPRPRGPRTDNRPKKIGKQRREPLDQSEEAKSSAVVIRTNSRQTQTLQISPQFTEPIIHYARSKYAHSFLRQAELCVTELTGFLANFGIGDHTSRFGSVLDVALSATALVYFGNTERSQAALMTGSDLYQRALKETRTEITKVTTDIPDELLLLVMLLANYEDKAGHVSKPYIIPSSYGHLEAAANFMRMRNSQHVSSAKGLFLDNIMRRRAIKMCINKGVRVRAGLANCAVHFVYPAERLLYHYMVELAEINAAMQNHVEGRPIIGKRVPLDIILKDAQELEAKLAYIGQLHARDARYESEILKDEPFIDIFESLAQTRYPFRHFNSISAAHEVLVYYAAQLRIKDIIVNALEWMEQPEERDQDHAHLLQSATDAMEKLVAGIFESVPYFFGTSARSAKNLNELEKEANALLGSQLIFPLHSVSFAYGVSAVHKQAAAELMFLVSRINANSVVEIVYSELNRGKQQPRIWPSDPDELESKPQVCRATSIWMEEGNIRNNLVASAVGGR